MLYGPDTRAGRIWGGVNRPLVVYKIYDMVLVGDLDKLI